MSQNPVSRRDFMRLSWRLLGALAVGEGAYLGLRFVTSREAEGSFGEVMTAGVLNDFPRGTITPFEQARFFLVRFEDGGFVALSTKCPHLACVVGWEEDANRFVCPCHGSEFERSGDVLNPPAPRPMDRFAVSFEGEQVKVDTRQAIQRSAARTDDRVYAPEPPPTGE